MREIILDTETTGLDARGSDRIVEIGCIELDNHIPTGNSYHQYVNPERDMPEGAFAVHGLSEKFLADQPVFAEIADAFIAFVADAPLVIHNADFDMGFLNAELTRIDYPPLPAVRAIDTLRMARTKFPGAPASLDALCKRFQIDNGHRQLHGALKDADLLALVYLELIGGRQANLELARASRAVQTSGRQVRAPRPHAPSAEEQAAHADFIGKINDPVWES
jgi:DNA polymerase-3 subunit epsilon